MEIRRGSLVLKMVRPLTRDALKTISMRKSIKSARKTLSGSFRRKKNTNGDDEAARAEVVALLKDFGWQTLDLGMREAARAIEPLAMLWCIPGFRDNSWQHALHMLRG